MIEQITGYSVTCDICGAELALIDDCTAIYDSETEASCNARECGWEEFQPGKWACEDCAENLNKESE